MQVHQDHKEDGCMSQKAHRCAEGKTLGGGCPRGRKQDASKQAEQSRKQEMGSTEREYEKGQGKKGGDGEKQKSCNNEHDDQKAQEALLHHPIDGTLQATEGTLEGGKHLTLDHLGHG